MKLGNEIVKILGTELDGFKVNLKFKDRTKGFVSLSHIFSSPKNLSLEILTGNMFDKCFIESGALAWPNGFELCPDALYHLLKTQKRHFAA